MVEANGTVKQRSHVGDFLIDERSGPVETPIISRRYLIRDNLGSVSVILDDHLADGLASSILSSPSYDAFGAEAASTRFNASADVANMTRGYTDHEQFDDLGIIHMNGRIYDADLGRFLSADPLVPHPYFSQSYNRYSYVLNNPLSLTDPTGFEDDKCQGRWGDIPLEDAEELDICGGFGSCNPGTSPSPAPSAPKGPTLIKQYTQNPSTRAYHFAEKRMSDFKRWDSAPEFSRDWDRQSYANVGSAVAPDAVASGEVGSGESSMHIGGGGVDPNRVNNTVEPGLSGSLLDSDKIRVTSAYNAARGGQGKVHGGVDIVGYDASGNVDTAANVLSISGGRVSFIFKDHKTLGNAVQIKLPSGNYATYAHLSSVNPNLRIGSPISVGDEVGVIGSTGRSSKTHLHFQVSDSASPGGTLYSPGTQYQSNGWLKP